jgi:hypothetical protein
MTHLHLDHPAEGPEDLSDCCDMLLKLDDGSVLPAHSLVLARCSHVLLWHVHQGPLASASAQNKPAVPLMECETNVAIKLLTEASALPVAGVARKYGMKVGAHPS